MSFIKYICNSKILICKIFLGAPKILLGAWYRFGIYCIELAKTVLYNKNFCLQRSVEHKCVLPISRVAANSKIKEIYSAM